MCLQISGSTPIFEHILVKWALSAGFCEISRWYLRANVDKPVLNVSNWLFNYASKELEIAHIQYTCTWSSWAVDKASPVSLKEAY